MLSTDRKEVLRALVLGTLVCLAVILLFSV
jgi:hypothetical protein